jgi:peptide chain release factor subunit 3
MSESKPKISLKDRLKNKEKKEVQEFVPTEETKVIKNPAPQPIVLTEAQKLVFDTYEQITKNYNQLIVDLQKYANTDLNLLSEDEQYAYSTIMWKMTALSNPRVDFKTIKNLSNDFDPEEFFDIVDCHKLLLKYTLMQTDAEWAKSLEEYERLLKKNFGTLESYNEDEYDTDNTENKREKKKKAKKKPKLPGQFDMNNMIKPILKPLVFKPEEIIDIEALKLENKDKELNVFDESKEPLVSIFIGHVDSGKSTICGTILYLSGKVNELEIAKFKEEAKANDRESWYVAYVMDINEEEKERGKTVEMGRAAFETTNKRFTLLDCPGHRNYVQNMISGAAQADLANLVISAKPGEFESGFEKDGQTREHAMLAQSLGAEHLIIIINKMDTVNWSEDRYNYILENLMPFLVKSCGFDPKNIHVVAISGLMSTNIKVKLDPSIAPWYKGLSLWETFDSLPRIKRSENKILRIPILDKFKEKGVINTYTKIASGVVKPNMTCILMPSQKPVTISKILDVEDNEIAFAGVGESVNLHIKGIDEEEIKRGFVICGQQYWIHVCEEFEADVSVFELQSSQFFGVGFTSMIHMHTILEEIEISAVWKYEEGVPSGKKISVPGLKSGEKGGARFRIRKPICLEKYSEFRELGRFALRKETITLASGIVTRIKPLNPELLKKNAFFVKSDHQEKEQPKVAPENLN